MWRTVLTLPGFLNSAAAARRAAICLSLALFSVAATARAQTRVSAAQSTPGAAANGASPVNADGARAKAGDGYRIGAGDVLDIRVFNRPQLSREAVRVDGNGMIRMPLVEGEVQAACRTEAELARSLESLYLKYLRSPHVDVFIKEFQSQPVAVIGAVNLPGRFQLQRPMRLLELLTLAGGPSERAGARVQVAHAAAPSPCEPEAVGTEEGADDALSSYRLGETLGGGERANPYVRPGDIVNLPEAEQAFVVGNVLRPTAIDLKEPVTISRAIAMAGGTMPDTRRERVRILRQTPGATQKQEIFVDLRAVERQQAEDVALQPDDIVDVPVAGGKRILRSLLGGVFPAAGQLPVQVIGGQVPTAATRRH